MRIVLILSLLLNLAIAQKLALVIGNSNYNQGYLPNPTKDADLIAQKLESVGFKVTLVKNIDSASKMKKVINNFVRKLHKDDIAVVYYAGHGVQCLGKNYLMPTQANVVKGGQLASEAVDLNFLIGGLSEIKLAIVMLDACRNNTYPSCSKSQTRGLVQPTVANNGGMIISFATAENDIALDGNGDHSPYALALSKFMNQSLPIETFFREVGGEVFSSSGQRPMLKNSFYGRFSFKDTVLSTNASFDYTPTVIGKDTQTLTVTDDGVTVGDKLLVGVIEDTRTYITKTKKIAVVSGNYDKSYWNENFDDIEFADTNCWATMTKTLPFNKKMVIDLGLQSGTEGSMAKHKNPSSMLLRHWYRNKGYMYLNFKNKSGVTIHSFKFDKSGHHDSGYIEFDEDIHNDSRAELRSVIQGFIRVENNQLKFVGEYNTEGDHTVGISSKIWNMSNFNDIVEVEVSIGILHTYTASGEARIPLYIDYQEK